MSGGPPESTLRSTWTLSRCAVRRGRERDLGPQEPSTRVECLGGMPIAGERHLHLVLSECTGYCHFGRAEQRGPTGLDVRGPLLHRLERFESLKALR